MKKVRKAGQEESKMADPKPEKPYKFDSISKPVTQTDLTQWQLTLWDYLKSINRYKKFMKKDATWATDKVPNRGFTADTVGDVKLSAEDKADVMDSILLKIGTYGPKALFIDITQRSTSFKFIWNAVRKVCGFPVPGAKLIQYMTLKHSFDPSKTSFNDHYWAMRDMKIASLLTKDSEVTFNGQKIQVDEEITPSLENQLVVDWLESIKGIKLVKFIGHEYAKELETVSLYDLQESIGQQECMQAIIDKMESEEEVRASRAEVKAFNTNFKSNKKFEKKTCYFCKEIGSDKYKTHDTQFCRLRNKNKKYNQKFQSGIANDSESASSDAEQSSSSENDSKSSTQLSKMKANFD